MCTQNNTAEAAMSGAGPAVSSYVLQSQPSDYQYIIEKINKLGRPQNMRHGFGASTVIRVDYTIPHDAWIATRKKTKHAPGRIVRIVDVRDGGASLGFALAIPGQPKECLVHCVRDVAGKVEQVSMVSQQFGVELGLWNLATGMDEDDMECPFVLRPQFITPQKRSVMIWDPKDRRGSDTYTAVKRALLDGGFAFRQDLIEPEVVVSGVELSVRRSVWLVRESHSWKPVASVWVGRPYGNLRVFEGATDAVVGVVF